MGLTIGVIADTHGLVRPEALQALAGVEAIVHAGDIGGEHVLEALRTIAPVTFVRGNVDESDGLRIVRWKGILITHILPRPHTPRDAVRRAIARQKPDLVIFGHSHLPHNEVIGGIRFFNPASAGPRRFDYPVSVGISDGERAYHVPLDRKSASSLRRRMNQMSFRA